MSTNRNNFFQDLEIKDVTEKKNAKTKPLDHEVYLDAMKLLRNKTYDHYDKIVKFRCKTKTAVGVTVGSLVGSIVIGSVVTALTGPMVIVGCMVVGAMGMINSPEPSVPMSNLTLKDLMLNEDEFKTIQNAVEFIPKRFAPTISIKDLHPLEILKTFVDHPYYEISVAKKHSTGIHSLQWLTAKEITSKKMLNEENIAAMEKNAASEPLASIIKAARRFV